METIEVRYHQIATVAGHPYYHKYIVYTDGNGNEYYVRGGPSLAGGSNAGAGLVLAELIPGNNSGFGSIVVESGAYLPGTIDWAPPGSEHSELIVTSSDLSGIWSGIVSEMSDLESGGWEYRPLTQNSNTAVDIALHNIGLPLPQDDGFDDYWAPASPGEWGVWLNDVRESFSEEASNDLPDYGAFKMAIVSPLAVDLDGDGIELISLQDSTVFFDLDVDGFAQNTGWVAADDALLALDVDGDGIIDDGSELFGDQTGYGNGFLALAAHDSNSDGVIDALDTVFSDLVVWQDVNGDGFSAESEMFSLTDVGITSIDLGYTNVNETNAGHSVLQSSTVTFADGSVHDIDDVYFENDPRASVALLSDGFEYHEDAFKLPVLFGYGHIASTWVVLSMDAGLRADASALVAQVSNGDIVGFEGSFEDFLFAWAGVDAVAPDSRGPAVNAQKLAFLEKAYGEEYYQGDGVHSSNPGPVAALELDAQFDELISKLAARFIAQSAVSDALQSATNQSEFDASLADHPFAALAALVSEYSPSNRNVEAENYDWIADIVSLAFGTDPTLTIDDLQAVLRLLSVDLDDDVGFRAAVETSYVNAGATVVDAHSFADGVFSVPKLYVNGTTGDDTIAGDEGDNVLVGGDGNDTYVWGSGMGNDVTDEEGGTTADVDRLVLTNLNREDVRFVKMDGGGFEHDLKIEVIATGEWLIMDDQLGFSPLDAIEEIEFADGTVMTESEFEAQAYSWTGVEGSFEDAVFSIGNGNDVIVTSSTGVVVTLSNFLATADGGGVALFFGDGTSEVEVADIRGRLVIDQALATGFGVGTGFSENYVHTEGMGSYAISDYSSSSSASYHDSFTFTDLLASEVTFSQNAGGDLVMTTVGGDVITVTDHFVNANLDIENIEFADGTLLSGGHIRNKSVADQKATGFVQGTQDGDYYVHAEGDGSYTIKDGSSAYSNDSDILKFTDLLASEVTFSQNAGGDLVMTTVGGDVITVTDHFVNANLDIENIEFADGTLLSGGHIRNKSVADQKATGFVQGTQDGDYYVHAEGDGSYTIKDGSTAYSNDSDILKFTDLLASEVTFSQNAGGDLVMTTVGGDVITVTDHFVNANLDIENIEFADGTRLSLQGTRDKVLRDLETEGDDTIIGNDNSNIIHGRGGNDWIDGGLGDDFLYGGAGNDLIIGDTGADFHDGGSGNDTLNFTYNSGDVAIDLGVGTLTFSGGGVQSALAFENVIMGAGDNLITGSSDANSLFGGGGNDSLYGGDGDDTLNGGNGNDHHYGEAGNDLLIGNGGVDAYDGGTGFDTLDFSYSGTNSTIDLEVGTVVFSHGTVNQTIDFEAAIAGSGHNTLLGTDGINMLDGNAGNDTLIGGLGSDTLIGGTGSDVFVFADDTTSADTATDYSEADDMLDIGAWGATGFGDLTVTSVEQGSSGIFDVEVAFGGNMLHLADISAADLTNIGADDFIFS